MNYTVAMLGVLLAPTASSVVSAQVPLDTLRLNDALAQARAASPMLAAARLGADAAAERVAPAGALPDPQLTLGLMNRPIAGFGADERMTMNQIQLSQMIPWPGKRGLAQERARFLASAESFTAAEAEVALISRVTTRYYELAAMDRSLAIMERTRGLLRDFFEVSQARYAVGETPQQDVFQAQVAVARMTEDITILRQRRIATVARLNALLGLDAMVPVSALTLPTIGPEVVSIDSLMRLAARQRPALRAAFERSRAAEAGTREANRELYPDIMVSLAYGQRPQFDDMATLMVGFSLPIWAGSKQLPLRREMQALEAQTAAAAADLYNETFADLTEARAEAHRARELGLLYATAILPQARAAVDAALSAYRVGTVDYMTLVENEMTVNRYEIELVQITAQYHQAVARIDALLGVEGTDQ